MGALDDAIREHLELKRQHGAAEEEIRRAEAEALGPARREVAPDPVFVDEPGHEPPPPTDADAASDAPPPPTELDAVHDAPPAPVLDDPGAADPFAAVPSEHVELPEPVAGPTEPLEPHEPVLGAPEVVEPPQPEPYADAEAGQPPEPAPVEDVAPSHEPSGFDRDVDDPDRARTAILDEPLDDLAPLDPAPPPVHHEPGPDEPPAPARPVGSEPPAFEPADTSPREDPAGPAPADEDVLEETPDFLQETPEHDRLWFEQKPPRDFDFDD